MLPQKQFPPTGRLAVLFVVQNAEVPIDGDAGERGARSAADRCWTAYWESASAVEYPNKLINIFLHFCLMIILNVRKTFSEMGIVTETRSDADHISIQQNSIHKTKKIMLRVYGDLCCYQ